MKIKIFKNINEYDMTDKSLKPNTKFLFYKFIDTLPTYQTMYITFFNEIGEISNKFQP